MPTDDPAGSRVPPVPGLHEPVMLGEVLTHLEPDPDARVVDATVGLGGHAEAILERHPRSRLTGLDRDAATLAQARDRLQRFGDRVTLVRANFADLAEVIDFHPAAILADLGISSFQLAERGFSFQADAPLDFRMDDRDPVTAAELVNGLTESELADLIYRYGEERASRRVAKAIVKARPLGTTVDLAEAVATAVPRRGRLHPATRTFQALRIAVNNELGSLERFLAAAEQVLAPGGRLAVISFESLSDRIVKRHLKESERLRRVNKRVLRPSREETRRNSRARSAKLRVAERT